MGEEERERGDGEGEKDVRNINQMPPVPGLEPTTRICVLTEN